MPAGAPDVTPLYLEGQRGRLFCLSVRPTEPSSELGVLFVPPFAEEMNRGRHMFAMQARALGKAGIPALVMDPFGTGDSEGDFGEATIDIWLDDLNRGLSTLAECGCTGAVLVALRFGALLAGRLLDAPPLPIGGVVLWQPITSGRTYMTQFLRLRLASDLTAGRELATVGELEAKLARGESVDVAGYELSPALYAQATALSLPGPRAALCAPVVLIDIGNASTDGPRPAVARLRDQIAGNGTPVETMQVHGAAFWQTPEITSVPPLIEKTVAVVRRFARVA